MKENSMLLPEQVKPLLCHTDYFVRRAALEYFQDIRPSDTELLSLVFAGLDACPDTADRDDLVIAVRFPLNDTSLTTILSLLAVSGHRGYPCPILQRMISGAPVDLLVERREEILALRDHLAPDTMTQMDRRIALAQRPAPELWQDLQDFARKNDLVTVHEELDTEYVDDLLEALARHDMPDTAMLCRELAKTDSEIGWLEAFLGNLAGRRRATEAIPLLVDKLGSESESAASAARDSLAVLQDPSVPRRIRDVWAGRSWDFRAEAAALLGCIKHPDAEAVILTLLETEDDCTVRTDLCTGLCRLFSEPGIEVVRREIRSGYDTFLTCLEDDLLPLLEVFGCALSEERAWRTEAERHRRAVYMRRRKMYDLSACTAELQRRGINPFDVRDDAPDADGGDGDWRATPPVKPIRIEAPKVGRNDPCPCGSGKKFKKCCGRAQ